MLSSHENEHCRDVCVCACAYISQIHWWGMSPDPMEAACSLPYYELLVHSALKQMCLFFFVRYSRVCNTAPFILFLPPHRVFFVFSYVSVLLVFSLTLPYPPPRSEIKLCSRCGWEAPAMHSGEERPTEAAQPCIGGVFLFTSWNEQRPLKTERGSWKDKHWSLYFQLLANKRRC